MSESTNPVSDGVQDDGVVENVQKVDPDEVVRLRKQLDIVLGEKKKAMAIAKEFQEKEKTKELEIARQKEDFKKLAELKEQENLTLKQQIDAQVKKEVQANKYLSFMKSLNTQLEHKYFSLVDLDQIIVDAEGNVDELSVAKYAEHFRTEYPAILTSPKDIKMPLNAPQPNTSKLNSLDDFTKLKSSKEMYAKLKEALELAK